MKNNKIKMLISLFPKTAIVCLLVIFGMGCSKKKNEVLPNKTATKTFSSGEARFSGFSWANGTATGNWLSSSFLDGNNGYISGLSGAMAKTTNGGATYTAVTTGTTNNLYACYFLTTTTGFVAGDNNTFLKTTDGGTTWATVSVPGGLGAFNYRGIYFYNSTMGFATGGNGAVFKTTDGGLTWVLKNTGIGSTEPIYSVFFTDALNGHAGGGYGKVYKTTDGGSTWIGQAIYNSRSVLNSVFFTSASRGYVTTSIGSPVVGDSTLLFITNDGGSSWFPASLPSVGIIALSAVKFFDANHGYVVGGNVASNTGNIISTSDGGTTWVSESVVSYRLVGLSLVTTSPGVSGVAYAVGLNNEVLKGQ